MTAEVQGRLWTGPRIVVEIAGSGPAGPKGDVGATGPQGPQGIIGPQGPNGADATINGVTALTIAAEGDISIRQEGNVLTISAPGPAPNAGAHNSIYRGKYLGSAVTEAQYAAIAASTFEDLFIGDYWTIGGITYRIAAFDYYLNCGDIPCTQHHAVLVPDTTLYTAKMNDINTTVGGYVGSKMRTEGLEQAKAIISAAFNGHVLSHRVYLTNAVTNGRPSAGAWCDSEVDLMNEQMVYGGSILMPLPDGTNVPANYRVEKSQLPLFAYCPDLISNRRTFWLRDVVTASYFALVRSSGHADSYDASSSLGVRPAFCVC